MEEKALDMLVVREILHEPLGLGPVLVNEVPLKKLLNSLLHWGLSVGLGQVDSGSKSKGTSLGAKGKESAWNAWEYL